MMVDQFNNNNNNNNSNNSVPWQSTIPNQMPWLNQCPSGAPMRFGQPTPFEPANESQILPIPTSQQLPPPAVPIGLPHTDYQTPMPTTNSGLVMTNNPFVPQQLQTVMGQTLFHNITTTTTGLPCTNNNNNNDCPPLQQPTRSSTGVGFFESSSLTQIPHSEKPAACESQRFTKHKRSSFEMEDDLTEKEAPPTKQQLSESRLFKRFGSLQLNGDLALGIKKDDDEEIVEEDSDDSDSDSDSDSYSDSDGRMVDRKDFNRYVYLLFKDKKSNNLFNNGTSSAMDRLIRDERDKLNKAVILWTPPMRDSFVNATFDSDDDDDEIRYNDHRDFLKSPAVSDDADELMQP